eukprot:GHUV01008124.1.p1 GENE.GHUV01008124.1~~GHUV01008124.1.p1  ORF type:complete len:358 (+),score=91.47 GHUV01008124.1:323-1396(+)
MDLGSCPVVCQIGGDGAVVDACYTLAGDKVATCSNTGAIQVWACSSSDPDWDLLHVEELPDPATTLSWAHPEHGLVFAVGSRRGTVHVIQGPVVCSSNSTPQQREQQQSEGWCVTGKLPCGQGPIHALAFAPRQYGLILAAACQEQYGPGAAAAFQLGAAAVGGTVTLWEAAGIGSGSLQWMQLGAIKLPADTGSIRCMCWREAAVGLPPLLALGHDKGGCIWAYRQEDMAWQELCSFSSPPGNQQSLLAINWAPALGRPFELLAASYGTTVVLYKALPAADGAHGLDVAVMGELQHPEPVWKLEFNMLGNMLACSLDRRPEIWFWVPPLTDGPWRVVSRIVGTEQQAVDVGGEMLD